MPDGGAAAGATGAREPARLPRDAQLIISLLHQMGIQDWEPRVINQLLEYTFREPSFWQFLPLAVPAVVVAGRVRGGSELVPRALPQAM